MFTIKQVLAHHDGIPLLITATSDDGRLWGGMTLADEDVPEYEYATAMFLLTPTEVIRLEDPLQSPLEGNWLRETMQDSTECWIWNFETSYHRTEMKEEWLPTAEAETEH
jgi:hypothetical protein